MCEPGGGGVGPAAPHPGSGGVGPAPNHASSAGMRQVLAAYVRNAHTLSGPSRLEDQIGAGKFNLAKDVVLHRVGGPVVEHLQQQAAGSSRRDPNYPASHPLDIGKQIWMQRERFMRQVQEHSIQLQSEKDRLRERQIRPVLTPDTRASHLSGEKIRLLRESQKEAEKLRLAERRAKEAELQESPAHKAAFKSGPSTVPIMSSSDKSWADLEETIIGGQRISCFKVGGEPRLCLPQILNSVLERLSLTDINQACEELQIYCATCTPDQLQVLKDAKVLPETAYQCGLITKSDVERLCSFLLEGNPPRASIRLGDPKTSPFSFRVEHDCFGHCEGLVLPEAYTEPEARCIECAECEGLFSPHSFVTHAHNNKENRTCHWGFSSDNWRIYLRLNQDYGEDEASRCDKLLQDFKLRFVAHNSSGTKRQQDTDDYDSLWQASKRSKVSPEDVYPSSAYRPWYSHQPFAFSLQPYPAKEKERKYAPATVERYKETAPPPAHTPTSPYSATPTTYTPSLSPKKKYLEREKERFPTLADEISTIKEALEGAPDHAKEAVLKILERLTKRVDRAERERDLAVANYRDLQTRHGLLEEELAKKRGELRELLRQDNNGGGVVVCAEKARDDSASERSSPAPAVGGRSVNLCLAKRNRGSVDNGSNSPPPASQGNGGAGLPKIELMSPVRVMQEMARSRSSSTRSEPREVFHGPQATKVGGAEKMAGRMVKMDTADLNILRQELISQPSPPLTALPAAAAAASSASLSYTSQKLGSNGANSNSPTPSPPSNSEDPPSLAE